MGDSSAFVSWGSPDHAAPAEPPAAAWRIRLREFDWFDLIAVIIGLAIWDFVAGLVLSGYFAVRCGGNVCTLHQDLHRDHLLYWLVPLVIVLPPILLALKLGRLRLTVLGIQLVVLVAATLHTMHDAHVTTQHINGTVKCWSPDYSPKDCPWGVK